MSVLRGKHNQGKVNERRVSWNINVLNREPVVIFCKTGFMVENRFCSVTGWCRSIRAKKLLKHLTSLKRKHSQIHISHHRSCHHNSNSVSAEHHIVWYAVMLVLLFSMPWLDLCSPRYCGWITHISLNAWLICWPMDSHKSKCSSVCSNLHFCCMYPLDKLKQKFSLKCGTKVGVHLYFIIMRAPSCAVLTLGRLFLCVRSTPAVLLNIISFSCSSSLSYDSSHWNWAIEDRTVRQSLLYSQMGWEQCRQQPPLLWAKLHFLGEQAMTNQLSSIIA